MTGDGHGTTTRIARVATRESMVASRIASRLGAQAGSRRPSVISGPAAILFSDISGSTQLAESLLATFGSEGTDRLTDTLNQTFGDWVRLVERWGGEVVRFAGDALLAVWWSEDVEGSLPEAVDRAVQCALELREALAASSGGSAEGQLSLRVAVGAGSLSAARIGGVRGRWEIVAGGPAMLQLAPLFRDAERGEIVVSSEAFAEVQHRVRWASPRGQTQVLAGRLGPRQLPNPSPPFSGSMTFIEGLLPAVVRRHIDRGLEDFLAEHRRVTVLFILLHDLDLADSSWIARLDAALQATQNALDAGGGALDKVGIDDKGVSLLAAFGLPAEAPEAQEQYAHAHAVRAALDVLAELERLGVPASAGLASGKVYCGLIGNDIRREYTMIGDTVNRAARLMKAPSGAVVCDAETRRLSEGPVAFDALDPITLRGFTGPVERFSARAVDTDRSLELAAPRLPIVGRDEVLARLLPWLLPPRAGGGRGALITGSLGVGKSRLASELAALAGQRGARSAVGRGERRLRSTPTAAWRGVIDQLYGLVADASPAQRVAILRAALPDEEALLLPVLSDLLDLDLEEGEPLAPLSGVSRAESSRGVLTALLAAQARKQPLLIVLDDAHWFDSSSRALAEELVRSDLPIALVLSARAAAHGADEPLADFARLPSVQTEVLSDLAEADIAELIRIEFRADGVSRALVRWMMDRTGGNPYFCMQLLVALQHAGALRVSSGRVGGVDEEAWRAVSVPPTIEGLLTHRLDRLDPMHLLMLRCAAVIAGEFDAEVLDAALPPEVDRDGVPEALQTLVQEGLLVNSSESPRRWRFGSGLVQELAYDALIVDLSMRTHGAVARFLEVRHQDNLGPVLSTLAYHWKHCRDLQRTLRYRVLAADDALLQGAMPEAERFYAAATRLVGQHPELADETNSALQRAQWLRKRGQALFELGRHAEADAVLRDGLALLGQSVPKSNAQWTRRFLGQFLRQRLHRLLPSVFTRRRGPANETLTEAAACLQILVSVCYWEYDFGLVFPAIALWALNLQERAGALPARRDVATVGLIHGSFRLAGVARAYFARARERQGELGDDQDRFYASISESIYSLMNADWEETWRALDRVDDAAEDIGHDRLKRIAASTRGFCHMYEGRFAEARALVEQPIRGARRLGNLRDEFSSRVLDVLAAIEQGELATAEADLTRTRTVFSLGGQQTPTDAVVWGANLKATLLSVQGRHGRVAEEVEEAVAPTRGSAKLELTHILQFGRAGLALADAIERGAGGTTERATALLGEIAALLSAHAKAFPLAQTSALLVSGRLMKLHGKTGAARRALERGLALATSRRLLFDRAMLHAGLAGLPDGAPGEAERHADAARAQLEEIGAFGRLATLPAKRADETTQSA